MQRVFVSVLLLTVCCIMPAYSQMSLVQCMPANGAEQVPLSDTLSWIFSEPLDTLAHWNTGGCTAVAIFDPWEAMEVTGHRFSDDLRVMAIMVNLQPNTDYVWAFTNARSTSGDSLVIPAAGHFTTAASHGSYAVSGQLLYSGSTDGVIATLFDGNPAGGTVPTAKAAVVLSNGSPDFTLSDVRDGVYWPIAVRDNNMDGIIDPYGDEAGSYDPNHDGMPDSIVVNGSSLTGIDLNLHGPSASPLRNPQPRSISLSQNFPNPFNPTTEIEFSLSRTEQVRLAVFDILGREVAVLGTGQMSAGLHRVQFDGANLPAGIYFYRLEAGAQSFTRKMMLLK
jgi:hypothetical protein